MPHTSSDIYWEEHGQGPLTLVMLPGFGASADLMTGIARHLSGFRILVFDLPGHGQSVRAPAVGGKDVVVDQAKQLDDVRRIPGSRAVLLSELGHLCGLEMPDVVANEISNFLETEICADPAESR
ncbi:alpha/beta fold hydrolase [Streptosporangium sp. NPDC000396]|uniref:alpha/beta fold hydrolase n=1 Tax=Streptosporangium sp. NPDC000396 TaxID=3366185 RepID=UPI0036AA8958